MSLGLLIPCNSGTFIHMHTTCSEVLEKPISGPCVWQKGYCEPHAFLNLVVLCQIEFTIPAEVVDPAPLCDLISHITCRDSASVNRTGILQESFRIRTRWATSKPPQKQRTKRKQRGKIVTCGPKFCLFDFLYCIFRAFGLPVVLDRGVIFELSQDAQDAQFHRICLI